MFKVGEKEKNMMRDVNRISEIDTIFTEISQAPPFQNLQHSSAMNRVSHFPSNSLSNGYSMPEERSSFEEQQQHNQFHHYGLLLESKLLPDSHRRNKNANGKKLVDDGFGLCESLYQLHIRDDESDRDSSGQMRRFERDSEGFGFNFGDVSSYNNVDKYGFQSSQSVSMCFNGDDAFRSSYMGGYEEGNSFGSYAIGYNESNDSSPKSTWHNNKRNYILEQRMEQVRSLDDRGILLHNTARPYLNNSLSCHQHCGVDVNGGRPIIDSLTYPSFKFPLEGNVEGGVIIQGKDMNCGVNNNGLDSLKLHKKKSLKDIAVQNLQGKGSKPEKVHGENMTMMTKPYSLAEVQGRIFYMAKDQNGCRFLQRIFDEGSSLDVQIIFNEIVDNIVELMMDPFGNYLVQKLLDVCSEEQKLQIVVMVTKEPGQLVRISLNTYGTRVVQKLIETLQSRQQISLVKYALKPGILDLIKDLNGNHVLQRWLQCLDYEDNKIIFDAATKYCVEIAQHVHGCCVLQRCISHSNGQHQDKLMAEVIRNALLLAQDPFGNYVVQYIIELKNPSTTSNLLSQFKGHYVHLSTQKFSSHVVEKCLKFCAEGRSQIIRELTSAGHFEQLMQDPFANYVIQSALLVTKGPLHASLVEAVLPHTILRTSPYCKRIFSRSLLKKC